MSGDFNGDGKTDLALANTTAGGPIPVALSNFSNGSGSFTFSNWTIPTSSWPWGPTQNYANSYVVAGDFNGDGKADLASFNNRTDISVALSDGKGTFTGYQYGPSSFGDAQNFTFFANVEGAKAVTGDFNGDGLADIALVGGVGWSTIPVALSNGDGGFHFVNFTMDGAAGTDSNFPLYATQQGAKPTVGDFNGDGVDDIALTGGIGWGSIPVAFSNGNGTMHPVNHGMTAGDTNLPLYAAQEGATPDEIYPLNHIVQMNHWTYDSSTACTVGGVSMHCCPTGSAMIGLRLDYNVFKCAPLTSPGGAITLSKTMRSNLNGTNQTLTNMLACPIGQVMKSACART